MMSNIETKLTVGLVHGIIKPVSLKLTARIILSFAKWVEFRNRWGLNISFSEDRFRLKTV